MVADSAVAAFGSPAESARISAIPPYLNGCVGGADVHPRGLVVFASGSLVVRPFAAAPLAVTSRRWSWPVTSMGTFALLAEITRRTVAAMIVCVCERTRAHDSCSRSCGPKLRRNHGLSG